MCISKRDKNVAFLKVFHFRTISKAAYEKIPEDISWDKDMHISSSFHKKPTLTLADW